MTDVDPRAAPWARHFTTPLRAGDIVCSVCHSQRTPGYVQCSSCASTARGHGALRHITPITYWESGVVASLMWNYKEPRSTRFGEMQAVVLEFLRRHQRCVTAGQSVDVVTAVPSTRGRPGAHPMAQILSAIYRPPAAQQLLEPDPAHVSSIGHGQLAPDAFRLRASAEGRRVLLVDDTFTTGARIQSAALALHRAGGEVVGAMVVGRRVNSAWRNTQDLLDQARMRPFSWDRCAAADGCFLDPQLPL